MLTERFINARCLFWRMGWKTYLIMYFGTELPPSDLARKVESIGFETHFGPFDFIYHWGEREPSKDEVLALGDKVAEALKGTGAVFNLDTHD